jgi:hypothetical protein
MGTLILGGWIVVGLLVAGYERTRGGDSAFETQLCVVGAIAGGFAGQITRWYVFGEPLGFVFAAAGAELLLRSYRRRTPTAAQAPVAAPPLASPSAAPAAEAPSSAPAGRSMFLSGVEAFAWGVISACLFAATAVAGELAAERIYLLNEPHVMSLLIYEPVGLVIGFVLGVRSCLKQPRRTIPETLVFLALAAFAWGALIMTLGRWDASYEHGPL